MEFKCTIVWLFLRTYLVMQIGEFIIYYRNIKKILNFRNIWIKSVIICDNKKRLIIDKNSIRVFNKIKDICSYL